MTSPSPLLRAVGLLLFCCATAVAATEGPRPTGAPGKEIWELTSYLKGSPDEVRALFDVHGLTGDFWSW